MTSALSCLSLLKGFSEFIMNITLRTFKVVNDSVIYVGCMLEEELLSFIMLL